MTSPSVKLSATVDDVQARTDHQFTADERYRVAILCADASAMARSLVPTMPVPAPATAVASPPEGLKAPEAPHGLRDAPPPSLG
jgi:hypothetical protein